MPAIDKLELRKLRRVYRCRPYVYDPDGKQCCTCRKRLPRGMFSASMVRGVRYLHSRCIKCRASTYLRSATCKAKRALIESLKDKPCAECGQKYKPSMMVFVHTRGVKKFSVGMAWTGRTRESIVEESTKCAVMCSNCERDRRLRKRERASHKPKKLADLAPELGKQVDLASRLEELYGPKRQADQATRT